MDGKAAGLLLPEYVQELVSEVEDRTGYPLLIKEEVGVGYDSELRIARPGKVVHELAYVPEYREFRLHFLVNGAFKILRLWDVPPGERYMPASQLGRGLAPEDYKELRDKLAGFPSPALDQLSEFLYHGICRQLTSMPLDIRVEREIAEELPDHYPAQRAYLMTQVKDLEPTFLPEMAEVCPERLYAASTAMNVVLAEEAAELTGVQPGKAFLETPYRALGERLREKLHSVQEKGYPGDRLLTDAWAGELGMEDWYEWVRLDETGW